VLLHYTFILPLSEGSLWQNAPPETMDDSTPQAFLSSFRSDLLRRRVGFVALAVMLALACLQLLNNLVWYLLIPLFARLIAHSGSVMFDDRQLIFPTQQLMASITQFALAVVAVYYLNRWLVGRRRRPAGPPEQDPVVNELGNNPHDPSLRMSLGALADEANRREEKASAAAEASGTK
jgi:hypothetical protein